MTEKNSATEKNESSVNFEKSLAALEALIKEMESGNLNLEKSIDYFERGMTLSQRCQKMLHDAEQKVEILSGTDKNAALQPYSEHSKDDKITDSTD